MSLLNSGAADLALAFSYPAQEVPSRFHRIDLFEDPLFLVTPSSAPLKSVEAGGARRWVTGCEQCRGELLNICELHGFTPDIAMGTDDYVAVQALVASGYGITILPRLALDSYRHAKVKTTEIPGHARTVMVLGLGAPPLPALQALVIQLLQQSVAER